MRTPKYLRREGGPKYYCYVHYFNLQFPFCFLVWLKVGVKFKGILRKNQCLCYLSDSKAVQSCKVQNSDYLAQLFDTLLGRGLVICTQN